eukprot:TRINITY_DN9095_c0_g1_i1.p1 TRINITY_DN9095_c0_g1~~TRINITY_DN9095_c0_g1_i1.p1  ORF type:complete len:221 (+),score=18.00 TRINITY_DN9095_c0_g1_i1:398-1060(+)
MLSNRINGMDFGPRKYMNILTYAFPHNTVIQLTLMQSLLKAFRMIAPETKNQAYSNYDRGVCYIMVSSLVYNILRYTIGRKYLEKAKVEMQSDIKKPLLVEAVPGSTGLFQGLTQKVPAPPKESPYKQFLTAPLVSAALSIIVCSIPPIRSMFIDKGVLSYSLIWSLDLTGKTLSCIATVSLGTFPLRFGKSYVKKGAFLRSSMKVSARKSTGNNSFRSC